MDSLPQTIDSFFASLVPAFWQLISVLVVTYLLVRRALLRVVRIRMAGAARSLKAISGDPLVKESGLLKLVPVMALVVLVVLAIGLQRVTLTIGYWIPGQLSWTQPDVMVHAVSSDRLGRIWSSFEGIESVYVLYNVVELKASEAEREFSGAQRTTWQGHDEEYARYARLVSFVKFIAVFALVAFCYLKRKKLANPNAGGRLIAVWFGCIGVLVYCFAMQVEAKKQSEMAKTIYIDTTIQLAREQPRERDSYQLYVDRIEAYRSSAEELNSFRLAGFTLRR